MPDEQVAASSAAETLVAETVADQAVVAGDMAAFREARRAERAGKPLSSSAESTPAAPGEQAASTEASSSPASESGTPSGKKNAETRIPELLTDRAQWRARAERAERELQALRSPQASDAKPAASSTAPAETEFPDYAAWAERAGNDGKTFEQYTSALIRHEHAALKHAEQQDAQQAQVQQDRTRVQRAYDERLAAFVETHADFAEVLTPLLALPPSPTIDAISEAIKQSEQGPQLAYALAKDPAACTRLCTLPVRLALYELGKLASTLTASPPTRTLTTAPTPPTTLGRKAADPTDPIDELVAEGDMSRFKAHRIAQRAAQHAR